MKKMKITSLIFGTSILFSGSIMAQNGNQPGDLGGNGNGGSPSIFGTQENPFTRLYTTDFIKLGTNSLYLGSLIPGTPGLGSYIFSTVNPLIINGNNNINTGNIQHTIINPQQGSVGVGTATPTAKLDVNGTGYFSDNVSIGDQNLTLKNYNLNILNNNGKIAFGDNNAIGHPNGGVNVLVGEWGAGTDDTDILQNHGKNGIKFTTGNYQSGEREAMFIGRNGNIGIGTTKINDNFKLSVGGKIRAEEIEVSLSAGWADYVFEDNYKLNRLSEVEKYIEENKHLPNVPSAQEVEENGVNLVQMDATLLRKIEELTLYVISQEKKIKELQKALVK